MTDPVARLRRLRHADAWIYGTMAFSASLSLSVDAVRLAANPNLQLSCNINAVISCGTVAESWQAHLFGFPNAFLGLVAEPVVITIAVAGLAGVRFPRGFMFAAQVVYTLGVIFAYWLFYEAIVNIGALCPWCLVVTVSTTLVFGTLTHVNIRDDNLYLPARVQRAAARCIDADYDVLVVTIWLLALALLIVTKYGKALFR
jgi:uncharacterized membrane protein